MTVIDMDNTMEKDRLMDKITQLKYELDCKEKEISELKKSKSIKDTKTSLYQYLIYNGVIKINSLSTFEMIKHFDYYQKVTGIMEDIILNEELSPRQVVRLYEFVKGESMGKVFTKQEVGKYYKKILEAFSK